ncbi:MAG TPA: hypothetical protein VKQ71_08190 [Acidimicrobiales bacterium]|nr:hypothetical protein [Acidimicrobiales bacterium]
MTVRNAFVIGRYTIVPTIGLEGHVDYRLDRDGTWSSQIPGVYSISGKQLEPPSSWEPCSSPPDWVLDVLATAQ